LFLGHLIYPQFDQIDLQSLKAPLENPYQFYSPCRIFWSCRHL